MAGGLQLNNIMYVLKLIPHEEVTQNDLDKIIKVKSTAWPYSYEKQLDWIRCNLNVLDIHVLLYLDGELLAYLNLVNVELFIDGIRKHAYGIGNVCVKKKKKGFGKELIKSVNSYLVENNKYGLLFCKKSLVNFYSYNNWLVTEKKKLTLMFDNNLIETMVFNLHTEFQHIEYLGKSF